MKKYYVSAIISGLVFTTFMIAFDYFTQSPMPIFKYAFQGLFFGGVMAFINYKANKNRSNSDNFK